MLATLPREEKLDPRVKRTRSLIQQAFMQLLTEKGFRAITVQDITERAEVNRATFYAHFADKYALLEESIRQMFRQELEKRMLRGCHYSEGNLQALIATVCEFVAQLHEHCKFSEQQFQLLVENQVRKQIQELIELWLEQASSEINPQTAATATSWAIYGLAVQWSQDKSHASAQAYARQVLPLVAANMRVVHPI